MRAAGLLATLNTDDPALTDLDLGYEYASVADAFGWGWDDMVAIALDGVTACWLDDTGKAALRDQITQASVTLRPTQPTVSSLAALEELASVLSGSRERQAERENARLMGRFVATWRRMLVAAGPVGVALLLLAATAGCAGDDDGPVTLARSARSRNRSFVVLRTP